MHMENSNAKKPDSVVDGNHGEGDGDGLYSYSFHRLVLKEPSPLGCSSRVFYRGPEGVPFQWEMQPGTPKNPPKNNVLVPPLSPPPALQNLGLPSPCLDKDKQKETKLIKKIITSKNILFWKKINIQKNQCKEKEINMGSKTVESGLEYDLFDNSDRGEFVASFRKNSSSLSSSSSSNFSHDLRQPKRHFVCIPWDFTTALVRAVKRV